MRLNAFLLFGREYVVRGIMMTTVKLVIGWGPGGHRNIKMLSHQYGDPPVKDKTAYDLVILNMGITIPGKMVSIFRWGPPRSQSATQVADL